MWYPQNRRRGLAEEYGIQKRLHIKCEVTARDSRAQPLMCTPHAGPGGLAFLEGVE
jgi:hypothetical protein